MLPSWVKHILSYLVIITYFLIKFLNQDKIYVHVFLVHIWHKIFEKMKPTFHYRHWRKKLNYFYSICNIYIQDLDAYKQTTREELVEWTSALKRKNIPDWLIVVVSTDESKLKSKLLPRSSVFDKIKSDFCNKTPDRLVHHRIKCF